MEARWSWQDVTLSVLLLGLLVLEIAANPEMTPHPALLALSVPAALPLVLRRSYAGVVAVVVCAAELAMSLVATGPFAPQLVILPVLVAVYTAGGRTRGAVAVAVGGLTAALVVAAWIVTDEGHGDDFWPWMLWAGAWAAGTFVRRRTDVAAHHAGRAALLEVEARNAASESAQRERDRIARELHDVVGHAVSVMVVQAGAERLRLGADAGRTGRALEAIEESGRAALAELRTMLGVLRDDAGEDLAPLPGLTALPSLVDRIRSAGLPVELSTRPADLLDTDGPATTSAVGLAAYRIVQEALTNVIRHAAGAGARVDLAREPGFLRVQVSNSLEGAASDALVGVEGRGLVGMRERVHALGGSFEAGHSDDGYVVRAALPLGLGSGR